MITSHVDIDKLTKNFCEASWTHRIRALSKAITLIENNPTYTETLLNTLSKHYIRLSSESLETKENFPQVIGLTGYPGAGKSTLVNLLIKKLRAKEKKVAVLAIDPSSTLTGGAVLGDRIRMQEHFKDNQVFIRSMSARGALGGLSKATNGVIALMKLLGFDYILIETVGIGQSESEIIQIANTVLLTLLPNTGDEVQFMKSGVIQLAHIFVINKCDLSDPFRMVHELEDNDPHKNGWKPPVVCTSASNQKGLNELILEIENHKIFYENQTH